jgi:nucleoside-diphosphate-sugar epimerase
VYVTSDNLPKNENDLLVPLDGLTLSKTTIDHFMPLTDVEFYGLRFGSVNGWSPNMRLDLMINSMTISGEKNGQVIVMNGHAHRPILSTNDLVRAVDTIVNTEENNRGVYNLASVNHNIAEIGKKVADYLGVELIDNGNNYTYDFAITSQKFMDTFNFTFNDTVETIIESIKSNRHNYKWTKREVKKI